MPTTDTGRQHQAISVPVARPASRIAALVSEATGRVDESHDHFAASPGLFRGVLLGWGACAWGLLSAWVVLLDRSDGKPVLKAIDDGRVLAELPSWWVFVAAVSAAVGAVAAGVSLWKDTRIRLTLGWCRRWLASHPLLGLALLGLVSACSIDMYELFYDPFNRKSGFRAWMIREDIQSWLALGAAVLGAMALSAVLPGKPAQGGLARGVQRFRRSLRHRRIRWWGVAVAVPLVLGAGMCAGALEGIPHFSDALTYLMQGRILHNGQLWLPSPEHHDLFQHSLFFIETQGRFFGKYPIGWPLILGTFDRVGLGYLANASMAALATVLTGLVASQIVNRRVAVLAAVLFGLSPWVWFNGANFASHVASTSAVLGFVWLFLMTWRRGGWGTALAAGLVLGAGVLIRPFDAAAFALPVAGVILACQVRQPKRWLALGALIAAGAMVGVGVYLAVNAQTTGSAFRSAYAMESRWQSDWHPTLGSMLGRLAFQCSELNSRFPGWGIGGLTVGLLGAVAAGSRWRSNGLRLLTASTAVFFFGCTVFGFTNVWWGPRWLLPATPLLAILGAVLIDRVLTRAAGTRVGREGFGAVAASQMALCLLMAGLVVGLTARYGGRFYQHRVMPPHMVSGEANRRVRDMGIHHAVVAMPLSGARAPLDARAGIVFMGVPFESNDVIYVRAETDWVRKARQCYPDRALYELVPEERAGGSFEVGQVPPPDGTSKNEQHTPNA